MSQIISFSCYLNLLLLVINTCGYVVVDLDIIRKPSCGELEAMCGEHCCLESPLLSHSLTDGRPISEFYVIRNIYGDH